MSVSGNGDAVPWWTYSANEWVKARIRRTDRVFEYGCGGSTLWLAANVASVVSVEHDQSWFAKIQAGLPENAQILLRAAEGETSENVNSPYCQAIKEAEGPFDVIVIDGMERNACAKVAADMLAPEGIIIFDNSHRSKYKVGMEALSHTDLWRIDLFGCVPGLSVTSIFGRSTDRWLSSSVPLVDVGT
jgi:protein-L-isoaspartate O-methyltransferase